jgi:hypothetical protein
MCPEFLLAILYFTILFLVNSFLWKVLQSYAQKIQFVEKIKRISSLKLEKKGLLSFLLSPFRKEKNSFSSFSSLKTCSQPKDLILLGATYDYLRSERKQSSQKNSFFDLFSLQFLEGKQSIG